MNCPRCASSETSVKDTRRGHWGLAPIVSRTRVCDACSHRWHSIEVPKAIWLSFLQSRRDLLRRLRGFSQRLSAEISRLHPRDFK